MIFLDSKDSSNTESQDPFPLRPYQRELAEPAMDGKNCMIVAPTGKTTTLLCIEAACCAALRWNFKKCLGLFCVWVD